MYEDNHQDATNPKLQHGSGSGRLLFLALYMMHLRVQLKRVLSVDSLSGRAKFCIFSGSIKTMQHARMQKF